MQAVGWSRRAFLAAPLVAWAETKSYPSEQRKFRDRSTEWILLRLTDPENGNSWLPPAPAAAIDRGGRSLLICSDRSGSRQIYSYDVRSGVSQPLTDEPGIQKDLFSFAGRDGVLYVAGNRLNILERKPRELHRAADGWDLCGRLAVSADGRAALVTESRGDRSRLVLAPLRGRANPTTVAELDSSVRSAIFRPRSSDFVYLSGEGLHFVQRGGTGRRRLPLADGTVRDVLWSADGQTLFYLHSPPGERGIGIRQFTIADNQDRFVSSTSQFVSFSRNRDSTVFIGVSGNKGSPYLLLLVRSVKRELAIAEHGSRSADDVVAFFAPDSQSVFYHSDMQGRFAVYSIGLERFVEKTGEAEDDAGN